MIKSADLFKVYDVIVERELMSMKQKGFDGKIAMAKIINGNNKWWRINMLEEKNFAA